MNILIQDPLRFVSLRELLPPMMNIIDGGKGRERDALWQRPPSPGLSKTKTIDTCHSRSIFQTICG